MTDKQQNPYLKDNTAKTSQDKSTKESKLDRDSKYSKTKPIANNTNNGEATTQSKRKFEFGSVTEFFESLKRFSIKGRITRLRYISSTLALFIVAILSSFLLVVPVVGNMLLVVIVLAILAYLLRLSLQRCQDCNFPTLLGAVLLIALPALSLLLYFIPGSEGKNNYGPQPSKNSTLVVISATILLLLFGLAFIMLIAYPWIDFLSFRKKLW